MVDGKLFFLNKKARVVVVHLQMEGTKEIELLVAAGANMRSGEGKKACGNVAGNAKIMSKSCTTVEQEKG